jgi:hypothetical protein
MAYAKGKAGRPAEIIQDAPETDMRLHCQACDRLLTFVHTILGGVVPVERWDRYVCHPCKVFFEYRRRTRTLRRAS